MTHDSLHWLHDRTQNITDRWYNLVVNVGFASFGAEVVRQQLEDLVGQTVALLLADPFIPEQAQDIGTSLARIHLMQPELLGGFQELLADEVLRDLTSEQTKKVQPRLIAVLSNLATGFLRKSHETILAEQEEIRRAYTASFVRLENALRSSEEKYRTLVESADQAIFMVDRQGIFHFLNGSAASQLGGPAEDFIGKSMWDLFPKETADLQMTSIIRALDTGEALVEESVTILQNKEFWRETTIQPLRNSAGEHRRVLGLATDVTKRKLAESSLRRYAERLGIIHEIDRGILAAASPKAIAETTLEHVQQLIPSWETAVILFDFESSEYFVLAGEVGEFTAGNRYPIAEPELIARLRGSVPVTVDDILKIPERTPTLANLIARGGRAVLSAPLYAGEELMGVFVALAYRPGVFGEEHLSVAGEIASSLAIAIQNVRLLEAERVAREENASLLDQIRGYAHDLEHRVQERTQELSALYEVTSIVNRYLDLRTVLEQSLERAIRTLDCVGGLIHLFDKAKHNLELTTFAGFSSEYAAEIATFVIQNGLANVVLEQGRPLVKSNLAEIPNLAARELTDGCYGLTIVSMRAGGSAQGIISVLSHPGQLMSNDEVALLASIADHVGGAVENARLRQSAEQVAVLEERERLARELHDSVTQGLYSLTLFAEAAQERMQDGKASLVQQYLDDIGTTAHQALKEMRLMLYELRPSPLDQEGLVEALRYRLDAVEGRAGLKTRLLTDVLHKLPAEIEEGLHPIALEALNNVIKHAEATEISVNIRTNKESVFLEISDNGKGFDLGTVSRLGGLGLPIMRERVEKLNGKLTVSSESGFGTVILVEADLGQSPSSIDRILVPSKVDH